MTFDKETKEITINRGDRGTIILTNTLGNFKVGDKLKFSIIDKGNYKNLVFQKTYTVTEEGTKFYLTLTSEDTRFGEIISREKVYWYEIDYNDGNTLIGYDKNKGKKFVLYPEAPERSDN